MSILLHCPVKPLSEAAQTASGLPDVGGASVVALIAGGVLVLIGLIARVTVR